jgi:hypothetical protein
MAIKKAKKWIGFGLEIAAGVGLVAAGAHDVIYPTAALVSASHAWELIVAGAPFLGAGQTVVNPMQHFFGRPSRG